MSRERTHQVGSSRRTTAPLVVLAMLVAAAVIAGSIWWRPVERMGRNLLGRTGSASTPASTSPGATASGTPTGTPTPGSAGLAQPVAEASGTLDPTQAQLAAAFAKVPADAAKGIGTTTGAVLDARTGKVLWSRTPNRAMIPASTQKLLTCIAALSVLGPDTRFTTRVVRAPGNQVVLVGGGDPLLGSTPQATYPHAPASSTLAAATAKALKAANVRQVSLGYDDSLFSGSNWQSTWPTSYHDQVATISSLWIDKGRPSPTSNYSTTPAQTSAATFAKQLAAQGIKVVGTPKAARATSSEQQLASIQSLPVRTIVGQTLLHSDNSAAEVLLRQVGVATHRGGSFTGGAAAVRATLVKLGLWDSKASVQVDGSGLSRSDRTTAAVLARALHLADTTPRLGALLEQLPVAGVDGTLGTRFTSTESASGRGVVNAKTGTLTQVSSLAGTTVDAHGTPLVFSFVSNGATQEWNVRTWLDDMATAVSKS